MGLFGNKKEDRAELPPLQFPELPKSVPSFESGKGMQAGEAKQIKSAVSSQPMSMQESMKLPDKGPQMPAPMGTEQPLFVKIEKYRDVVQTLQKLKSNLNDADEILSKLNRIKAEEDRELSAWSKDLERIRNQLLDIDHKLFENA